MNVTLDVPAAVWLAAAGDKTRRVSRGRLVTAEVDDRTVMVVIPSPDPTGWRLFDVSDQAGQSAQVVDGDGQTWQASWRAKSCTGCAMRTAVMQVPVDSITGWVEDELGADPETDMLLARAAEIGLSVDRRWKIATLRRKVEDAEAAALAEDEALGDADSEIDRE